MALIQSTGTPRVVAGASASKAFPGALTVGNYIIAIGGAAPLTSASPTMTCTMNAGATTFTRTVYKPATAGFAPGLSIFWRKIDGTEGSLTVDMVVSSTSGQSTVIWAGEFSDLPASAALVGGNGISGDNTTSISSRLTGIVSGLTQAENLVVAGWLCNADVSSKNLNGLTLVVDEARSGFHDFTVGYRVTSSTADVQEQLNWTTNTQVVGVVIVFKQDVSTPPVNTVPTSGVQTTSDTSKPNGGYTAIPGASVAAGTDPVTYFNFSVPAGKGKLKMTLDGTTAVTAGANDSESVTLGSWSSLTELNNTISTLTFLGATGVHEKITVTMVSSDGTTPDSDTFYILNDMRAVTATGTNAQIEALMSNIDVILEDSSGGTVTITVTDATALFDTKVISLVLSSGGGIGSLLAAILRRRRGRNRYRT